MRAASDKRQATRLEHSAGGVVYRKGQMLNDKCQIEYLIGKHSGYHKWVLPKGLIEAGESPEETTVREIKEEMGVDGRIVGEALVETKYEYEAEFKQGTREQPMRRVKKYQEAGGKGVKIKKMVTWFLMEWVEGEPKDHDFEMEEAGWYGYDEAIRRLAFEDERMVLTRAHDKIS